MPTSNSEYGEKTTGEAVTAAFAPRIKDKIILVTGVNAGGIGASTATSLAAHSPRLLILAGRTESKVNEVIQNLAKEFPNVPTKFLKLDLSSQKSCRAAAEEINNAADVPQIDLLINNAGVMNIPERQLSVDGIEMQFATNHIGHFLFTNLIMQKILNAAKLNPKGDTRIINVSSRGIVYSPVRFSDHNFMKTADQVPESERAQATNMSWQKADPNATYTGMLAYGQSKSANVLFSVELTKELYEKHGILSFALHPGGIMTELGRNTDPDELKAAFAQFEAIGMYFKSLQEGCSTTLVAALDPMLSSQDFYLNDCQSVKDEVPKWCYDPEMAKKLWTLSEQLVDEKFVL